MQDLKTKSKKKKKKKRIKRVSMHPGQLNSNTLFICFPFKKFSLSSSDLHQQTLGSSSCPSTQPRPENTLCWFPPQSPPFVLRSPSSVRTPFEPFTCTQNPTIERTIFSLLRCKRMLYSVLCISTVASFLHLAFKSLSQVITTTINQNMGRSRPPTPTTLASSRPRWRGLDPGAACAAQLPGALPGPWTSSAMHYPTSPRLHGRIPLPLHHLLTKSLASNRGRDRGSWRGSWRWSGRPRWQFGFFVRKAEEEDKVLKFLWMGCRKVEDGEAILEENDFPKFVLLYWRTQQFSYHFLISKLSSILFTL